MPNSGSTTSSRPARRNAPRVNRCSTRVQVSACAALTRRRDPLHQHHHPGRITCADDRYSHARPEQQRRRVVLHRPSQQELVQFLQLDLVRCAATPSTRRSRADDRCGSDPAPPYPASTSTGTPSCSANRPTAAAGAAATSSGTNPSQATCTAAPPRPTRWLGREIGRTNVTSAASQCEIPDQLRTTDLREPRRRANSSSENTSRVATAEVLRSWPPTKPWHATRPLRRTNDPARDITEPIVAFALETTGRPRSCRQCSCSLQTCTLRSSDPDEHSVALSSRDRTCRIRRSVFDECTKKVPQNALRDGAGAVAPNAGSRAPAKKTCQDRQRRSVLAAVSRPLGAPPIRQGVWRYRLMREGPPMAGGPRRTVELGSGFVV